MSCTRVGQTTSRASSRRSPRSRRTCEARHRGLPFRWENETVARGINLTLTTTRGDIDLFGEITGGGGFEDLRQHAQSVRIFDRDVLCLDLPTLIRVKRAAGRPRDLEALAELEAIAEEIDR